MGVKFYLFKKFVIKLISMSFSCGLDCATNKVKGVNIIGLFWAYNKS